MDKNSESFSVEYQFHEYARRVKLDVDKVPKNQWIETRRAFFGAWGQMLMTLKNDLSELSEDDGVEVLEKMHNEVLNFWQREVNRQN